MEYRGEIVLIGAGPGDPGLLTVLGRDELRRADVVLYDRLVGEEILALIPAGTLCVDVGKQGGRHPVPQDEINRLLLKYAEQGKRVARLKGGDPYLFGRGAEEIDEAARRGIPFRVIPGVTSAVAVPAWAGIPVTHRGLASSVHILTGHGKGDTPPVIPYRELAALKGTLVFLMGVAALGEICGRLIGAGMPPGTPAALVENGTRPGQRKLVSTLEELPKSAKAKHFTPPSVLVVGQVCTLTEPLDWRASLPLSGHLVVSAGSRVTGGKLAARLRELGCGVLELPCIRMEPLEQPAAFWDEVAGYRWIALTSPYGAELFFDSLRDHEVDLRRLADTKFAAIGTETAKVIRGRGLLPDLMPPRFDGYHLGLALAEAAGQDKILLFRARDGTPELPAVLEERGAQFRDCAAYRTHTDNPLGHRAQEALETGRAALVTFTSASAVHGFARLCPDSSFETIRAVCIGESTGAAARGYGMRVHISENATVNSLAELVEQILTENRKDRDALWN